MEENNKKTEVQLAIIESLNSFLDYFLIAIILFAVVCVWWSYKSSSHEEASPPQETINPELIEKVGSLKNIHLEDGGYVIELEPDADLALAYYYYQPLADGRHIKIISGDQAIQSGDDKCFCYVNNEPTATLEDLAELSLRLKKRLRLEKLITPEELAIYDRYYELERTKGNEEAQRILGEELGLSETDVFWKVHNIFYIDLGHHEPLSPELFRLNMLEWALDYPSEQNWRDFYDAGNAVQFMYFASDYHLHLNDQETINQLIAEAKNQLGQMSEDYPNQLSENIPGIVDIIEQTFATYPENKSFFEDNSGNLDHLETALEMPGAYEDWTRVKTAMTAAGITTEKPAA